MSASTVKFNINKDRLISLLPHFFQSPQEALTELVQNAYRAKATRISFVYDAETHVLEVFDDGVGAESPDVMFTAASSGWDDDVVEPAGLGLFAMMGLSLSTTVSTRPGNGKSWTALVTPASWEGGDIHLGEADNKAPLPSGTYFRFELKPEVKFDITGPSDVELFRHLYPLDVHWTTKSKDEEKRFTHISKPAASLSDIYLDTPVGRLYFVRRHDGPSAVRYLSYSYYRVSALIWEHRVLTQTDFVRDLISVLEPMNKMLADLVLRYGSYALVLDPSTGVRPKLPDRREVIEDTAYKHVLETVAKSMVHALEEVDIPGQFKSLGFPELIEARDVDYRGKFNSLLDQVVIPSIFDTLDSDSILKLAGYSSFTWLSEDWHTYYEDDSLRLDQLMEEAFVLNPPAYRLPADPSEFARLGLYFLHDPNGPELQIRVKNLRYDDNEYDIAWCEGIELWADGRRIGSIDHFFVDDAGSRFDGPLYDLQGNLLDSDPPMFLVAAESAKAALARLRDENDLYSWVVLYAARVQYDVGDIYAFISDEREGTVDRTSLAIHIQLAFSEAYDKDSSEVLKKKSVAHYVNKKLYAVKLMSYDLRYALEKAIQKYPEEESFVKLYGLVKTLTDYSASVSS